MKHNEAWVEHALEQMTMPEKIGQMTQVSKDSITPAEVADHAIGSVLSGGNGNPSPNTPGVWADMVGSFTEGPRLHVAAFRSSTASTRSTVTAT